MSHQITCSIIKPDVAEKGVAGEIIFADGDAVTGQESPPFGAGLAAGQITDSRQAFGGARAHNRWLEEFCATNPVRRAGVALVPITHDIDEAVKIGDRVAVFGRGGVLEQYDAPERLLSNPANDFVAGFIGADRGYRGLQFRHATGLPMHDLRVVAESGIDGLDLTAGQWALVTKPDGSPYGWIDAAGVELHRSGNSLYDSTTAGGSLFRPDDSLRQALDAALSSPSGLGVAVDTGGEPIGGVLATDVLEALQKQRG